jgi:hypothetical protein
MTKLTIKRLRNATREYRAGRITLPAMQPRQDRPHGTLRMNWAI